MNIINNAKVINNLQFCRDKLEAKLYLKANGICMSEQELDALKENYYTQKVNTLTPHQMSKIAGGGPPRGRAGSVSSPRSMAYRVRNLEEFGNPNDYTWLLLCAEPKKGKGRRDALIVEAEKPESVPPSPTCSHKARGLQVMPPSPETDSLVSSGSSLPLNPTIPESPSPTLLNSVNKSNSADSLPKPNVLSEIDPSTPTCFHKASESPVMLQLNVDSQGAPSPGTDSLVSSGSSSPLNPTIPLLPTDSTQEQANLESSFSLGTDPVPKGKQSPMQQAGSEVLKTYCWAAGKFFDPSRNISYQGKTGFDDSSNPNL